MNTRTAALVAICILPFTTQIISGCAAPGVGAPSAVASAAPKSEISIVSMLSGSELDIFESTDVASLVDGSSCDRGISDDIVAGGRLVVENGSGAVIAVADIPPGRIIRPDGEHMNVGCEFVVLVEGSDTTADFYRIKIGAEGDFVVTADEFDAGPELLVGELFWH
ncbi:MAG: hypothetical protein CVT68_04295 [Actinobacteria bacterium HGW-Actinobacteria-8]|nr:MAG: hypothetical protein CVT68_04295 [Actinobacteria bacterium HGW-Actinobacteria-8]